MKTQIHLLLLTVTMLASAVLPLRAQVVADGGTSTLNGGTTIIAGDVTVGTNGSFTLLTLTNNALLTNSGFGYIGYNVGANSNAVRLTGANTRWLMGGDLYVGSNGAGNQLVLSSGALVENIAGHLGYSASSSNNQAVVTGAGSLWSNRFEITVGTAGRGNRLMITNGATVFSSNSVIVGVESSAVNNFLLLSSGALLTNIYDGVLGASIGANSNTAFLSDLNTRWLMGGNLHLGSNGAFNRLVISNGARVQDDYGYLGDTTSSSNNEAVVTGTGSIWTNRFGLHVGNSGSGNRLVITNGGVVFCPYSLIGYSYGADGNSVLVTGPGSLWTASELYVGYDGGGNQLLVSNGGVVRSGFGSVGDFFGSNNVVVTGAGSMWINESELSVGFDGTGNQLVVSNNGVVASVSGTIGDLLGANNSVLVTGAGSLWTNSGSLTIGKFGAGNHLVVTNGGVVRNLTGRLGSSFGAKRNSVLVTGPGSLWTASGLYVGDSGTGNHLVVSNSGIVATESGYIGGAFGANSNLVLVAGAGSLWANSNDLYIGEGGAFNDLIVSGGGVVANRTGKVGGFAGADGNSVLVTGAGSVWTNSDNMVFGVASSFNQLVISNGGVVANRMGIVGLAPTTSSNSVLVTGAGSLWTGSEFLIVGNFGSFNELVITNGAMARNESGVVGGWPGADHNSVVVTGAGSLWTNRSSLNVGAGSFNQLIISNGAAVRAGASAIVGLSADATNNSVVAVGGSLSSVGLILGGYTSRNNSITLISGSIWDVGGGTFTWGDAAFNDALIIDATSSLKNIGAFTLDENNTMFYLTNGSGGYRLNGFTTNQLQIKSTGLNTLVVGNDGTNVQVTISDYTLAGATGTIGESANARNNSVLVTGTGSVWSNSAALKIGNNGSYNQLTINNGGLVASQTGTLGSGSGSDFNLVLVNGTNSLWKNSGPLTNGGGGAFNQLVISDGGVVGNTTGTVGSTGSNNVSFITGAGSLWSNSSSLFIGDSGSFNQLVVSNSAVVRSTIGTVGVIGSNNFVLITGTGSLWTNSSDLFIGNSGTLNQLVVSNNGVVANASGTIGNLGGANSNSVLIADAGSLWTNNGSLTIGNAGAGNQLVVTNGGMVRNTTGTVGSTGSSNLALVTGAGSLWRNSSSLLVGSGGMFNRLVVSEGGTVANAVATVGNNPGVSGNMVLVTGAGSLWTNNGSMTLGSAGSFNQLVVSNGGAMRASALVTVGSTPIATNNSVLAVGGSLTSVGLTLGNNLSRNDSVTLRSNSTWNVGSGTFIWGNAGFNDTLTIDATSALTNIGGLTLDENNTAFFLTNAPGGYSLNGWTTNQFQFKPGGVGPVIVGNSGTNVQLTISDYALADTTGVIGNGAGANSDSVVVVGAGSLWTNNGSLTIGNAGVLNQLVVSNGGVVRNTTSTVGSSGNSNVVLVTGAGSLWNSSSSLLVGEGGTFNRLVISEGGVVADAVANVGNNPGLSGNVVFVAGPGSRWNNSGSLTLGSAGSFNQLVVSNGAVVSNNSGSLGSGTAANSNVALVTGAGSQWTNNAALTIGNVAGFNQLVISNGALVANSIGYLGFNSSSSTNEATVTGAGSLWNNRSDLYVGNSSIGNRLVINDSGIVVASNAVYLGFNSTSSNNLLTVSGGGLIVTNPAGSGLLDIRRGAGVLNSGAIDADRLLLTNSQGLFTLNGGTLKTKTTTNNNGQIFTVGNGTTLAAFELVGNGVHTFANGLTISSGALLKGNGNINGMLTVAVGATVSPGASVGKIVLNTPPALHGTVVMEISKNGASLTNDQIQVAGALAYGGSLTVSNLGPDALALGNSFPLFSAASYSGALAAITLPTLPAGLSWTNQLLANGSIAVMNKTAPRISGVAKNGANLIFNVMGGSPGGVWNLLTATNVTLPIASWTTNSSGLFDWQGSVTLTNDISLTEPQRFFLINAP